MRVDTREQISLARVQNVAIFTLGCARDAAGHAAARQCARRARGDRSTECPTTTRRTAWSTSTKREFYREIATAALQVKPSHALQYVPADREDYGDLARISVTANDYTLRYVQPKTRADFGELAMIAMRHPTGGTALENVPTDNPMYGTIAEAGVKTWFGALWWVPKDREVFPPNVSYYTIAKAAVTASGMALEYVPTNLPYYVELALIAVPQMSWIIRHVPSEIPEYRQIALSAIRANSGALKHVPYQIRESLRGEGRG